MMAKLPIVAEGTYGTRRVFLYDSAVLKEAVLKETKIRKRIDMFTIEFIDDGERRAVNGDDPNLKLWIHHEPCDYCKSIEEATSKSHRKKYRFCPMCGRLRIEI